MVNESILKPNAKLKHQSSRNHKLFTRHFDLFAISEPRDWIVLRVFHFALHFGYLALHHPQVLQRLFDNDVSYNGNSKCAPSSILDATWR